jgi:branched-chain amino acid transport system ATP-binding protein
MLEVANLTTGYAGVPVLHDVSLRIGEGELIGLLGANNAGKSTLINCLSGAVPAHSGRLLFRGVDFTRMQAHEVVELGIIQVPEGRMVFPQMSVRENLLMGGISRRARTDRARGIERALDLFPKLKERYSQPAGTLSGGEQQMLAIGRGLVAGAKFLMLDEPSLGLSPRFVQNIFQNIKKLHQDGLTILLVEQNLSLTLAHASRCYVLERGRIVVQGTSAEVKDNPRTRKAYLGL